MAIPAKKIIALSITSFCVLVIFLIPRTSIGQLPIGDELSIGEFSVFENIYILQSESQLKETDTFTIPNPNSIWKLRVLVGNINDTTNLDHNDGDSDDDDSNDDKDDDDNKEKKKKTKNEKIASFKLKLNGRKVFKSNQFNQEEEVIEIPVTLLTTNTITVKIKGQPGSLAGLMIIGKDNNPPLLTIQEPLDNDLLANALPTISGEYSDDISGINSDSFKILLDNVDITTKTFVGIDSFQFTPRMPISDGVHTLSVGLEDNSRNQVQESISFKIDATAPLVDIIEPANLSVFNTTHLRVKLSIDDQNIDENSNVTINGIPATLAGTTWEAEVPISEGTNNLVATAIDLANNTAANSISVRRDTAPPLIAIESPRSGDQLVSDKVSIAGTVNDIIPGSSINDDDVTVTINGEPAAVKNRTFFLPNVLLVPGINTITARAVDRAGNSSSTFVQVTHEPDLRGVRLIIVNGNAQQAEINSLLPLPLSVKIQRKDGTPEVGRPVKFEVSRGDGVLGDPSENLRNITVLTDNSGTAQMEFTLGSRTGEGFHRVRVTTPGSLTFAEFCATAKVREPINIAVVMPPANQSTINQALTHPISVIVADNGSNPVEGVPVTFKVDLGGGNFNGQESIVITTNSDGIAEAEWTLGPAVGVSNNEASANFVNNAGLPAVFIVSGVSPGPIEETLVSGIVQDSTSKPIVGAKAVIRGTNLEAWTGSDGKFTITGVQPGGHHVGILGSTANDPVNNIFYPDIEYAIEAISGVDNKLDQIVVLPFLDQNNAKLAGGNQDVILGMANVSGFSIKVHANSTFVRDPNTGSLIQQPIMLSSSQVKYDKVPMVPPHGSTPLVVGTIQPAGVMFDPPAEVCYPNTSGLAPGDVADIFAFHHDIGQFVSVGPGTVSEDGSVVCSDPGFGIVQSGWHCTIRNQTPTANCANDCSVDVSWGVKSPGDRKGFKAPVVMCWHIDKKFDPELPPPEQEKAFVLVRFTPGGGANDSTPVWSVDNPGIVEIDGTPSNGNSVTIKSKSAGTTTLRSPIYRIPLPDPQEDKTCQVLIEVKVAKVAFDINKLKIQNIILEEDENKDKSKCAMELYSVSAPPKKIDLSSFLTNDSIKDEIIFTVNNQQKGVGASELFITQGGVAAKGMIPFFIEAVHKDFINVLVDGKPICSDEMILVAVPQSTKDEFDKWYSENADLSWTKDLPAVYSKLGGEVGMFNDPEPPPEEGRCDLWGGFTQLDPEKNFIHPGASFDYRSNIVGDCYGHQATYNRFGILIKNGLGAGSADKFNPFRCPLGHLEEDFIPYVLAAQLDGNPVKPTFFPDNLNRRLLHQGDYLNKYLEVRPFNPNGEILEPEDCGTGVSN